MTLHRTYTLCSMRGRWRGVHVCHLIPHMPTPHPIFLRPRHACIASPYTIHHATFCDTYRTCNLVTVSPRVIHTAHATLMTCCLYTMPYCVTHTEHTHPLQCVAMRHDSCCHIEEYMQKYEKKYGVFEDLGRRRESVQHQYGDKYEEFKSKGILKERWHGENC